MVNLKLYQNCNGLSVQYSTASPTLDWLIASAVISATNSQSQSAKILPLISQVSKFQFSTAASKLF